MERHLGVGAALPLLVGALLIGVGSRAEVQPAAGSLIGTWSGMYQSTMDARKAGTVTLQVDSQSGSTFEGTLTLGNLVLPVTGVLDAPGPDGATFELVGLGPTAGCMVAGQVASAAGGPPEIGAGYRLVLADGSTDMGLLDLYLAR